MEKPYKEKINIIFCISFFILFGFFLYGNSTQGKFVWDDSFLVSNNPHIMSLTKIPQLFTEDVGAGVNRQYNFYRPLQMLSFALDYFFWKDNVFGFHLTNIFIHVLVAISIFFLVRILFTDIFSAFLTASLFLSHPIHTETVAYISGRAQSLSAFFILLSFIIYIKLLDRPQKLHFYGVIFFYILALLAMEYSIVLLLLIPLYHYVFRKRFELIKFVPLLGITLIYLLWREMILQSWSWPHFSPIERIPGFFIAITQYLTLLVWPLHLHMGYEDAIFSWLNMRVWVGLFIVFVVSNLLWHRKPNPLLVFSFGWFFVALLPVSNIFFPLWTYMAEHWLYVSSIGFFMILGSGIAYLGRRKNDYRIARVLAIGFFVFYSVLTVRQNHYWKEPIAFYERTLKYSPGNTAVMINLGIEYYNHGEQNGAMALFIKALDILLRQSVIDNDLAIGQARDGNLEKAIPFFKKAILDISYRLGLHDIFLKIGNTVLLKKVKEIDDIKARCYCNLAMAYSEVGNSSEAIKYYKKSSDLNPIYERQCRNIKFPN